MRHPSLTACTWIILTVLTGLALLAGFFFTTNNPDIQGDISTGFVMLMFSAVAGWLHQLIAANSGNGEVVTSFPGKGNHDLIFGATYEVISCACLTGRAYRGEEDKYVVVLKGAQGTLWSCVLPEEPPKHFVYTKSDHPYTPYAPATASLPVSPPVGGAHGETATIS